MTTRRLSIPPGSPELIYHAVPTTDVHDILPTESTIELAGDTIGDPLPAPTDPPPELLNVRIRWTFFILGCTTLLPWNVVITAMPFFQTRMAHSSLKSSFASYLTSSFTLANVLALGHATAVSKSTIPSRQIRRFIVWLTILNFCLTLSTFFTPSSSVFFAFIVFNGAAQAVAGSYIMNSVLAVASLFGPLAIQTMISGQAAIAIVISTVQVIGTISALKSEQGSLKESDGSAEERSAFFFFTLSTLFVILSGFAHHWLVSTPEYRHVAASLERGGKQSTSEIGHESERLGLISRRVSTLSAFEDGMSNTLRVARQNIVYEASIVLVFLVTLSVFPPITTSVKPVNPSVHPLLFTSVHFLVYNLGDFFGRHICSFPRFLIWSARKLLILSLARMLLIPLFLMCNVQRGDTLELSRPPIINSDLIFMMLILFLGFSNGYVSTLGLMSAPSLEHNPRLKGRVEDVDTAATVVNFCLGAGLAAGSFSSFAVKAALCSCNPFKN